MIRAAPVLALLALPSPPATPRRRRPRRPPPPRRRRRPPASSASSASAAPAQPAHHYAFQNGDQYGYISGAHGQAGQDPDADKPVIVRYLGMQDGVYTIAEVQDGAVVVAQCSAPCQQVRIRGKDLDQTLDLNPNSIVYEALTDAINGQLQVYKSSSR